MTTKDNRAGIEAALDAYRVKGSKQYREFAAKHMRTAISAYCKAEGVVMVPREPTKEMILAGLEELTQHTINNGYVDAIYRAMVTQFDGERDE